MAYAGLAATAKITNTEKTLKSSFLCIFLSPCFYSRMVELGSEGSCEVFLLSKGTVIKNCRGHFPRQLDESAFSFCADVGHCAPTLQERFALLTGWQSLPYRTPV